MNILIPLAAFALGVVGAGHFYKPVVADDRAPQAGTDAAAPQTPLYSAVRAAVVNTSHGQQLEAGRQYKHTRDSTERCTTEQTKDTA